MLRWPYLGKSKQDQIQVNTPWSGGKVQMTTIQFSTEIGQTQTVAIQTIPSSFFPNGSTPCATLSRYEYWSNAGRRYSTLHFPVDGWVYLDPQYTTDNYCSSGEYIPIPWTVSQFSGKTFITATELQLYALKT